MGDASGLIDALGQAELDQRTVADHLVMLSKVGSKERNDSKMSTTLSPCSIFRLLSYVLARSLALVLPDALLL